MWVPDPSISRAVGRPYSSPSEKTYRSRPPCTIERFRNVCHYSPHYFATWKPVRQHFVGKSLPRILRIFDSQAGGALEARMSGCVRCEHRASWQTICRFRKTAVGRLGGGERSGQAADGRFGRKPANCLPQSSVPGSDALAYPCFQCVLKLWTRSAKEKCFTSPLKSLSSSLPQGNMMGMK